jgi:hypothetical protein
MVTVYATAQDAALLTAIDALPAHGAHVAVRVVPHSFRQLNDLASGSATTAPLCDRRALMAAPH